LPVEDPPLPRLRPPRGELVLHRRSRTVGPFNQRAATFARVRHGSLARRDRSPECTTLPSGEPPFPFWRAVLRSPRRSRLRPSCPSAAEPCEVRSKGLVLFRCSSGFPFVLVRRARFPARPDRRRNRGNALPRTRTAMLRTRTTTIPGAEPARPVSSFRFFCPRKRCLSAVLFGAKRVGASGRQRESVGRDSRSRELRFGARRPRPRGQFAPSRRH